MAVCLAGTTLLDAARRESGVERPLTLRVVAPEYEPATGFLAPFGPGYERDLLAEFCRDKPCDLRWITAPDRDGALDLLRSGRADLVVGFPGQGGEERIITSGPAYYHARPVPVRLPPLEPFGFEDASSPASGRAQGDGGDHAAGPSASASSAAAAASKAAPSDLSSQASAAPEGASPAGEKPLFSARYVLDARSWALWAPFVPASEAGRMPDAGPGPGGASPDGEGYRWFWRVTDPTLHAALQHFWAERTDPDDTLLDRLEERYFGYLPGNVDPYEVTDFLSIVERRLPRYRSMIARAVSRADLDPLLFIAVIIQESRLDESTVSHTGVRGIMQLTRSTADFLNVDRLNPSQAIRGGARYLHMLWKNLEPLDLEAWDRWFFALAAFNQGPKRLEGAMELSRKLGGTGRTWKELKEVFPLLAKPKYAAMVGQNTCRGGEAVAFVERVRWYYHILRGLVALDRPEAQHLAPLLGGARVAAGF